MLSRFLRRPITLLGVANGLDRQSTAFERFVLGEQIILSRAHCHYETMATPQSGQRLKALQAVELAARARTPHTDPIFYYQWNGDEVGVWSWSKSVLDSLPDYEGEVIPETVLHPPADTTVRLVKALDGFEGQIWRNARLSHSRWWSSQPHPRDWAIFLRTARLDPEEAPASEAPPPPLTVNYFDSALSKRSLIERLMSLKHVKARDMVAAALVVIAAPSVYFAGQWAHLNILHQNLQTELTELSAQTAEINAARRLAQSAAQELNTYSVQLNRRHPSAALAVATEELSSFSIQLQAFEQSEDALTLNLEADNDFAPDALVRAMEANPLFQNVRLEPGRRSGDWTLIASLEQS